MIKDRWSPYLTASEVSQKLKKPGRSDLYALSKERKNITEQLHLMKVRIKQLEKEEKRAKQKTVNASDLADNIIQRRIEKKLKEDQKFQLKKQKIQEIEDLKGRNQEMKQDLRTSIAAKKELILEKNKFKAQSIKDYQALRKSQLSSQPSVRTSSLSPRSSVHISKKESSTMSKSRVEEEKDLKNDALAEIQKLETLEKILIDKLRQAYDQQKEAENKVVILINNPEILSKDKLDDKIVKG